MDEPLPPTDPANAVVSAEQRRPRMRKPIGRPAHVDDKVCRPLRAALGIRTFPTGNLKQTYHDAFCSRPLRARGKRRPCRLGTRISKSPQAQWRSTDPGSARPATTRTPRPGNGGAQRTRRRARRGPRSMETMSCSRDNFEYCPAFISYFTYTKLGGEGYVKEKIT
jgi:hypothetical protein